MNQQQVPQQIKPDPGKQIAALLRSQKDQIALALPRNGINADRLLRISLTELRKSPQLQKCNPLSFLSAVIQCAQLGLEPGSALGLIYLVPFKDEVTVIIGYQGMIQLALRSESVESIYCFPVFEGDTFKLEKGLSPNIIHIPDLSGDEDPAKLQCVYAVAKLKNGGTMFEVVGRKTIDKTKEKAMQFKRNSPWETHYIEMARKTGVRKLFKYLPKSTEMAHAAELDEKNEIGSGEQILEITNFETGEPITLEMPHTVASAAEVQAHKVSNAISDIWVEAIGLGINPEAVVNMTEADLAAAPESRKQSAIMVLRETIKKRAASK